MASIGSFGKRKPAIDLHFDWFGYTIRVAPRASEMIELEFLAQAENLDIGDLDLETMEITPATIGKVSKIAVAARDLSIAAVKQTIHPDDWDLFWKVAVEQGQSIADLMEVKQQITEAVAGFPTGQPSGSSDGPAPTPPTSAPASSSLATTPTAAAYSGVEVRSLQRLHSRPDLQVAIVQANEARTGRVPATV